MNQQERLDATISAAKKAQVAYSTFTQEQVNEIFRTSALAANNARISLAKMAVAETGMGIVEDKVIKNHFASEYIYNKYKDTPTCGEIERDNAFGIIKVAEPIGVIGGVVPTTNPTSTAIFKALLALKTRNAIIFSPHPRAVKSTIEAAKIVKEAAEAAGAPKGLIGWIEEPSVAASQQLMGHSDISIILATGGPGMVRAAYSSGKPALGVGAGNTPAVIDETADIQEAVSSILMSKTFDNGMICASEQSVVVCDKVYKAVKEEFTLRGAYLLSKTEQQKVAKILLKDGHLNGAIVGQPAYKIAEMAGLTVPVEAKVLIGEVTKIGVEEPFSFEKLSPVLAMYKAKDYKDAFDKAAALVEFGGLGHTSVLYTDRSNTDRVDEFGSRMKAGRTLINMPSSQGAIGDLFNFKLAPSLTLGCGSWGGNSVSQNVGPMELLNIKTVAERRENMLWFRVPPKVYFKRGSLELALGDLSDKKRAFIVTDQFLFENGYCDGVTKTLSSMGILYDIFPEVKPDPTLSTAYRGVEAMRNANPDVIISIGGGSPMDCAKIMWLLYEHPEVKFEDLALRFMDIRKRVYTFPELGGKASFVAIPTTSGTGSEVTPFAVITDDATGMKYPIADYQLTPHMAICDPNLVMAMPKALTAHSGLDVLTHALEALVSVLATEFTNSMALEAIRLTFKYLPASYTEGDQKAREKMHYASTLAGMAFANAFLGVCHSMAHKLGAFHHLPHGLSNALLLTEVIRYNADNAPTKQGAFSQYKHPEASMRYARVADLLGLGGKTEEEKVKKLIAKVEELKAVCEIPASISAAGVDEKSFMKSLDEMCEEAFDDQCTSANPRFPLISEIKDLYLKAFK